MKVYRLRYYDPSQGEIAEWFSTIGNRLRRAKVLDDEGCALFEWSTHKIDPSSNLSFVQLLNRYAS